MSGSDLACGTRFDMGMLLVIVVCVLITMVGESEDPEDVGSAICLRARYAMSGTDLAYTTICLRARYAMSGTDLPYGATRMSEWSRSRLCWYAISLRGCYAMSGTGIAYGATTCCTFLSAYAWPMRCPVLIHRMAIPGRCISRTFFGRRCSPPFLLTESPGSNADTYGGNY
eukprot:2086405-Rhodomonas_salina.6